MKTTEVNKELIGRRCECIFTGLMVTGVIEDTEENEHTIEVKVRFDHPHQWGDDLYNDVWAWGRKIDEFGTLHHLQLLEDKPDFQIMTVVFGEPISRIDRSVFEDVDTWGVCSLQGCPHRKTGIRCICPFPCLQCIIRHGFHVVCSSLFSVGRTLFHQLLCTPAIRKHLITTISYQK